MGVQGARKKRGRKVYGMREKRTWKAGSSRWQEVGETGGKYTTLHNILQSKKRKEAGANKGGGKRDLPLKP